MKRFIGITLVLAILFGTLSLGALTASAASYSGTWGNLSWVLDDEGALTISGEGEMDDLDPWKGDAWHSYANSIKTVVIEEGVTTIGYEAFSYCTSFTSVTIPDSVTTIGDRVFWGCTALESVTIPDNVTTIGINAFFYCIALESVIIGGSVTTINYGAFVECLALESVTISNSVTTISEYAFESCEALETVYYGGSEEQWNEIEIGYGNDCLLNANIVFTGTKTIKGDVDGDDYVDNTDAIMILKYDAGIVDLTDAQLTAADVNGDGYADNTDAIMVLKYDAGIIDEL